MQRDDHGHGQTTTYCAAVAHMTSGIYNMFVIRIIGALQPSNKKNPGT